MKTFRPAHIVHDPRDPGRDTLVLQPDEDLVDWDPETDTFRVSQKVRLQIMANDGSWWESLGQIVAIDAEDAPPLLSVKIDWASAALLSHEPSP